MLLLTHIRIKILFLFASAILASCSLNSGIYSKHHGRSNTSISTNGITTYIIKFASLDNKKIQASLDKSITAKGYLKKDQSKKNIPLKGICIEAFDTRGNLLKIEYLKNPLQKTIEYTDSNGHFKKKEVLLNEEYIPFKINAQNIVKKIIISSFENKTKHLLNSIEL